MVRTLRHLELLGEMAEGGIEDAGLAVRRFQTTGMTMPSIHGACSPAESGRREHLVARVDVHE